MTTLPTADAIAAKCAELGFDGPLTSSQRAAAVNAIRGAAERAANPSPTEDRSVLLSRTTTALPDGSGHIIASVVYVPTAPNEREG